MSLLTLRCRQRLRSGYLRLTLHKYHILFITTLREKRQTDAYRKRRVIVTSKQWWNRIIEKNNNWSVWGRVPYCIVLILCQCNAKKPRNQKCADSVMPWFYIICKLRNLVIELRVGPCSSCRGTSRHNGPLLKFT